MNVVNTLTLRHIKTHKKRSILTILAIIVSVAMVTAVFTSAMSFVNYFRNVTVAIEGSYHAYIHTDDYLKYKDVLNADDIEKYGIDIYYGEADVDSDQTNFEMIINAVDNNYLDLRSVKISDGEMPKNENEMLVHKRFMEKHNLNWKIGDTVNVPVTIVDGQVENRQFKIVGITESNVAETDSVNAFVYASDNYIKNNADDVSVYVQYTKLDKTVNKRTEELANKLVSTQMNVVYGTNFELLVYSGVDDNGTLTMLIGFCAIILVIIAIVSIFMIYDSFAVSYQERARYLGMLASVGATKRQKRNSIYFEGLILGLIGIPLGVLAGIGGIAITFKAISDVWISTLGVEYDGALKVYVNWLVIVGTVLASVLTIFVSSYIPARKASKSTAIEAIKQVNTVKVKKSKKLKTSKLANKLLGYEGTLAVKNFKRNGGRSRTIVFSLALSVIVFISVTNFSMMFSDVMKVNYVEQGDLEITAATSHGEEFDEILTSYSGIDEYFCTADSYASMDSSLREDNNDSLLLVFVDSGTIDSYASQLGADTSLFHNKNKPAGILHNSMMYKEDKKTVKTQPVKDVEGEAISLNISHWDEKKAESVDIPTDILVGVQSAEDWKNDRFVHQHWHCPQMFVSIELIDEVLGEDNVEGYTANILCDNSEVVQQDIEDIMQKKNIPILNSFNATAEMQSINNILKIVDVFVFGFIALITLISIMNIINTISNSMNERRREFAMIRSIGMTPKSFKKMIYYESFRYGLVSLLWSIPISIGVNILLQKVLDQSFSLGANVHPIVYLIAIVAVFIIIGIAILYSTTKIKNDNIIETLKLDIN